MYGCNMVTSHIFTILNKQYHLVLLNRFKIKLRATYKKYGIKEE